ncbi:MAG: 2,3-bisphosphoglycerate-independent phosphoglycerate mutase [Patescibacteria group bacterium]|nr:2,3-bisphosphoglycerate-independent phosphoglycerate mutase [Patescibacteria group bacterium]
MTAHQSIDPKNKQAVLIVLDGWGYREDTKDNAVAAAKTPVFDRIWNQYPHTLLEASGLAVGLPEGQMGNSEIGHTTIGAGKAIDTDLVRIKKAITTGEYDTNPAFTTLFKHVLDNNSTLHVQGLIGEGGVHSHSDHLFAFVKAAKKAGIKKVAIHVFTDGRDTPPQSAAEYLADLERLLEEINDETHMSFVATVSGRFFAMDRDNNWDRLSKVEQALFESKGHICEIKPSEFLKQLYKDGKVDEHLEPMVCSVPGSLSGNGATNADGTSAGATSAQNWGCNIADNDAVFFFNFRADRARMLSMKMLEKIRGNHNQPLNNVRFATLTSYGSEYSAEAGCLIAFPPAVIETTLAKELAGAGFTQAHIAETEKFPHATYFLNGGVEKPYDGEKHIMLASRKDVQTHDEAPEMRAESIADKAIEEINAGANFIFINFANPDMVGHTANVPAIITAVETVDTQLGRVLEALKARPNQAVAFVTADHGNAEVNVDQTTGDRHTAHTINPVPAVFTDADTTLKPASLSDDAHQKGIYGTLADITPTLLTYFEIEKPETMTGKSLI